MLLSLKASKLSETETANFQATLKTEDALVTGLECPVVTVTALAPDQVLFGRELEVT